MRIMNKEQSLSLLLQMNPSNGLLGSFVGDWPSLCLSSFLENPKDLTSLLWSNYISLAFMYISLQSGRFWIPVQVYQMKPFVLPKRCNALLSYDHISNTFQARYPTDKWRLVEKNITWDRLRLSSIHTSDPYALYESNNNDLKPGDHVEVQMRQGSETYDWCYGVIGHLDSCGRYWNNDHCSCEHSEIIVVSFKVQYSQWRTIVVKREVNGEQKTRRWRVGGIKKLENLEDIRRWDAEYQISSSSRRFVGTMFV